MFEGIDAAEALRKLVGCYLCDRPAVPVGELSPAGQIVGAAGKPETYQDGEAADRGEEGLSGGGEDVGEFFAFQLVHRGGPVGDRAEYQPQQHYRRRDTK